MKLTSESTGIFSMLAERFANLVGPSDPLSQTDIDKCANVQFANSTDIATFFTRQGGFIA
jgi:hypothetical protein